MSSHPDPRPRAEPGPRVHGAVSAHRPSTETPPVHAHRSPASESSRWGPPRLHRGGGGNLRVVPQHGREAHAGGDPRRHYLVSSGSRHGVKHAETVEIMRLLIAVNLPRERHGHALRDVDVVRGCSVREVSHALPAAADDTSAAAVRSVDPRRMSRIASAPGPSGSVAL